MVERDRVLCSRASEWPGCLMLCVSCVWMAGGCSEDINNMVTNYNKGNPEWGNLPRKFNIAVSGSRDDYAHTHINDIGLQPVEKDGTSS